jgi:hypothetical protein
VDEFDHHCPWLNNCIGGRNYKFFFASAAFVPIMLGILIGSSTMLVVREFQRSSPRLNIIVTLLVAGGLNIPLLMLDAMLLGFHCFLVARGITTYEYLTGKRPAPSQKRSEDTPAPTQTEKRRLRPASGTLLLACTGPMAKLKPLCLSADKAAMSTCSSCRRGARGDTKIVAQDVPQPAAGAMEKDEQKAEPLPPDTEQAFNRERSSSETSLRGVAVAAAPAPSLPDTADGGDLDAQGPIATAVAIPPGSPTAGLPDKDADPTTPWYYAPARMTRSISDFLFGTVVPEEPDKSDMNQDPETEHPQSPHQPYLVIPCCQETEQVVVEHPPDPQEPEQQLAQNCRVVTV